MTLRIFDFETGPEGADLTQGTGGNSGATAIVTNGGTAKFSTRLVRSGVLGARLVSVANQLAIARFQFAATNLTASLGLGFTVEANPATNPTRFLTLRFGSGVAMQVNWATNGTVTLADAGGANPLTVANTLTPGAGYWLSVRAKAATTTTGTVTAVIYDASNVEVSRVTSSAYNLGTNPFAAIDVGIVNTNPSAGTAVAFDYIQMDDGSTAEIAPPANASYAGSVGLSGSGTVSLSGRAALAGTTAGSGSGSLLAAGSGATASSAILAGSGQTSATGAIGALGAIALSGTGSQARIGAAALSGSATLSGSGELDITGGTSGAGDLDLAGSGQVSYSGLPRHRGAVQASSAGTLGLGGVVGARASVSLFGGSTLERGAELAASGLVPLTGSGVLEYAAVENVTAELALTGSGTLTIREPRNRTDYTVSARLVARTKTSTISSRDFSGIIQARRWNGRIDDIS